MARELKSSQSERDSRERREQQSRTFRRNQMLGLLLVAAAILAWGIFRAPQGWLFPPGWWKFW